jgi:hypothetical protein
MKTSWVKHHRKQIVNNKNKANNQASDILTFGCGEVHTKRTREHSLGALSTLFGF